MFSGIIETTAHVARVRRSGANFRVSIAKPRGWKLAKGQSVAIDGICSTVVSAEGGAFTVEYVPETLSKTTAGGFAAGRAVNLERSLTLSDFVDGHLIQGHVNARCRVTSVSKGAKGHLLALALPRALMRFAAREGSVAVNGVSLTIANVFQNGIEVALIPHTAARTNLGSLKRGDAVNVETDLIARYVAVLARRR